MSLTPEDSRFMARALRLAEQGICTTMPNPRVGALLVRGGTVVGEGWHRVAGGPHAEVEALDHAGGQAKGSTCYVTLEPCDHRGETGACTQALIAAGVSRVVYGQEDPNPRVAGRGVDRLRRAGLDVDGPLMDAEARGLNPGFTKRMCTGLPQVRIKMAISADGRTAMPDNNSFWITGPAARADVQLQRGRSCAVVTGWKSVAQDQSRLTLRPEQFGLDTDRFGGRQPLRVLLDSRNRLPLDVPFFQETSPILVANLERAGTLDHVEHQCFDERDGHVDLLQLLTILGDRECNEVLVEAGPGLSGAFLRSGLVDELLIYMAPKLMGSLARPLFDLPLQVMNEALPLHFTDIRILGRDLRITARPDLE